MKRPNHQVLQEAALFFLMICVTLQLKVDCFLEPNSPPDERYLGFTHEATDFTPAKEYDYIIIGGGTAGCPLAATLSEKYSVLLLERGGVPNSDPNLLFEDRLLNPLLSTNPFNSPAQSFFADGVLNFRGRVLGGSSMINFGFYSRAEDFFYQNSGIELDMSAVNSSYEWVENSIITRPARLRRFQTSMFNALVEAGVRPDNNFTVDHIQGTKVGGSIFDDSGRRHGAVELLSKGNPENLKVVVHAIVDRIIFSTSNQSLAAVGVKYHDSKGTNHEVHVRTGGEVILSAGAIGSPQLLLLSGIGPESSLSSQNIPVVLDNPFVGQHMADHPRTSVNILVPVTLIDEGLRIVGITDSGPYMESTVIPRLASIIPFIPFLDLIPPANLSVAVIQGKVSRPKSTGSLNLISSSDVTVSPRVRFNYYSQPEDLLQCRNIVDVLRNILETQAMEEYKFPSLIGPRRFTYIGPSVPKNSSDEESIATFCRKTLATFWHNHGGCLVNKVVDKHLKVIGVDSLRVVDASTFFNSPGTNPQATIMMLGTYIGDKILNDRAGVDNRS